jgi:hypothetical protein
MDRRSSSKVLPAVAGRPDQNVFPITPQLLRESAIEEENNQIAIGNDLIA